MTIPHPLRFIGRLGVVQLVSLLGFQLAEADAGSATWKADPTSSDWNTAANWMPATVPDASADMAVFKTSDLTQLTITADIEVASMTFRRGADSFGLIIGGRDGSGAFGTLTISGAGVVNESGKIQNFTNLADSAPGRISFTNNATAGDGNTYTNSGAVFFSQGSGVINFYDTASAGTSTFINEGTDEPTIPTQLIFNNSSSADHAVIIGYPGAYEGGEAIFIDTSTAASANLFGYGGSEVDDGYSFIRFGGNSSAAESTITVTGSINGTSGYASVIFDEAATAGSATLIAEGDRTGGFGSQIKFEGDSLGGAARVEIFGKARLDVSEHNSPGVTIGSLEGDGRVYLGGTALSIGSNNLDATFSGDITGQGSITKVGSGKLVLNRASTYTGTSNPAAGTIVEDGILFVTNPRKSATGTGLVLVRGGVLGGTGIVTGQVQIGDDSENEAILAPGGQTSLPSSLTCKSSLSFHSDGMLDSFLDSSVGVINSVVAYGVTIDPAATFQLTDGGSAALVGGVVFTVVDNTASTAIAGRFANLPDGGTIAVGSNVFQANYEGGDGNDLVLTVLE